MAMVTFKLPEFRAAVDKAVNAGVTAAAMQGKVQMRAMLGNNSRLTSSAAGQPPNNQTGRLKNSIQSTKAVNRVAHAGTNVRYGAILERGGVIRAKKGKFLAIPINPIAKLQSARGVNLRSQNMQVIKTSTGKILLVGKDKIKRSVTSGTKGTLRFNHEPVYLLKKSVTIQPHPYLKPAVFGPGKKSPIMRAAVAAATRNLGKFATQAAGGGA